EIELLGETFNSAIMSLKRTDEERQQIDKAKTGFICVSSHELRSPMTPVKAQLQMLLRGYLGKINSKQKDALEIIHRNIDRLDRIIVDLLEISRIEAARLKFTFSKVDVAKEISRTVDEMRAYLPDKKAEISVELQKLPHITADPDRLAQVLRNLLTNAIK